MACFIHYNNVSKKERLIELSIERHATLIKSKEIRQNLGGQNLHLNQCEKIPSHYDSSLKYHRKCYQKFTFVISSEKRKNKEDHHTRKSKRLSTETKEICTGTKNILFPEHCMFCKKKRITVKGKEHSLSKVRTKDAEQLIKDAANQKSDFEMLGLIRDVDIIAKEFQKHDICYKKYVKLLYNDKSEKGNAPVYERGDFDAVCYVVENKIISEQRCISMDNLLTIYKLGVGQKQYRYLLKNRLVKKYENQLMFITPEYHSAEVVISKKCLETSTIGETFRSVEKTCIKRAAQILRSKVNTIIESASELPWPPTVDTLNSEDRKPPDLLKLFFHNLLRETDCISNDKISRVTDSFCYDIMFAISKGKFLTIKHTSLGLGLHSMTGQKTPIVMLNHLGHCISYDKVCKIETGQAELAQHLQKSSMALPLQPAYEGAKVPTIIWWDNFDRNIETEAGGGSIHNTPGVVFQEKSELSVENINVTTIANSNRRSILIEEDNILPQITIHPKTNPGLFVDLKSEKGNTLEESQVLLAQWKIHRFLNRKNQCYPGFAGWIAKLFQKDLSTATVLTYLPPIQKPITEYNTIIEIFYQSRQLAKQCNMQYAHITMDVGAAIKAFHVIWNNPELWYDIVIHLGDFHAMMTFFAVIGSYVRGSGFEDIVFQAELCSPGCIETLMNGKHYNRCWRVHEIFEEALERLFIDQYCKLASSTSNDGSTSALLDTDVGLLRNAVNSALCGEFGNTTQYWAVYMKLIDLMRQFHYAININNFDLRLAVWDQLIQYCFVYNKVHYSRYGSYYINQLHRLQHTHPGAREEIENHGISVRRNTIGIGQAVDLAGEQTYMKSSKSAGGIIKFASSPSTVAKWVLNRPYQSKFTESLKDITDLSNTTTDTKRLLKPQEIRKSNIKVTRVAEMIKNEFISPFDEQLDKNLLYNLVSGAPVSDDITSSLLSIPKLAKEAKESFEERMIMSSKNEAFFSPIKKAKIMGFNTTAKKVVLKKDRKVKEISSQKDILGKLLSLTVKHNSCIDFEKALSYPLSPVSLPLCLHDGSLRKTAKSKLFEVAMSDLKVVDIKTLPGKETLNTYFMDMIAIIRTTKRGDDTIRTFTWKILNSIPKQYSTIYIVCDSYKDQSIKSGEREARGTGKEYVLNSPNMKLPPEFSTFMKNGKNKEALLNLIEKTIVQDKQKLGNRVIYFSNVKHCQRISAIEATFIEELSSDHEEADTKLVSMVEASSISNNKQVMVRSPSGDIDILVLFILHSRHHIFIDNGTGTSRKILDMSTSTLPAIQRQALAGLHAFSGNDYIPCFYGKGKKLFWNTVQKNERFIEPFATLGVFNHVPEDIEKALEEFVCILYGFHKIKNVDEVRSSIFLEKLKRSDKSVDLCTLPPCRANIKLHIERSNYVASIFERSNRLNMCLDKPEEHGWDRNGLTTWSTNVFPEDIEEILLADSDDDSDDDAVVHGTNEMVNSDYDSDSEIDDGSDFDI